MNKSSMVFFIVFFISISLSAETLPTWEETVPVAPVEKEVWFELDSKNCNITFQKDNKIVSEKGDPTMLYCNLKPKIMKVLCGQKRTELEEYHLQFEKTQLNAQSKSGNIFVAMNLKSSKFEIASSHIIGGERLMTKHCVGNLK